MRVVSVNVGRPEVLQVGDRQVTSGIYKTAQEGRVYVGPLGLEGDHVLLPTAHGGPDRAVYLCGLNDYEFWGLTPPVLSENLTVDVLPLDSRPGDRLQCGDLVLELTSPRVPCLTMETRVGVPGLMDRFLRSERSGAFARVLQPGWICAGDELSLTPADEGSPTLGEILRMVTAPDPDIMRRAMETSMSDAFKERFRRALN